MKKSVFLMTIIVCLFALATSSQATIISWDLDVQFSDDGTPPELPPPWLRATFDDDFLGTITPIDTVRLTMEALEPVTPPPPSGLTGNEFVSIWYFNFDDNPTLDVGDLDFDNIPDPGGSTVPDYLIIYPTKNVAGAGVFDFAFNFLSSNADRFMGGDTLIVDISGFDGLTANSFDFLSEPPAGNGRRHTAAHIQAIGDLAEDSGWIGDSPTAPIPEPATLLLLGVGLVGLAGFGRKKLNK